VCKVRRGVTDLGGVHPPLLFYDGPCQLCQRSVRWVHRRAPGVTCLPLQGDEARRRLPADCLTVPLKGVVVVDACGEVHVGHRALQALAPHVSGPWRFTLRLTPKWGYALVAQTRFLWGRGDRCESPK
jgi:predicted DCC family thiol-disulfide oxidoreductase YuxK